MLVSQVEAAGDWLAVIMHSKSQQARRVAFASVLGVGFAAGAYWSWPIFQDYQTLWQVQADEAQIATHHQKTQVKKSDPHAFLDRGTPI
jgi:hypothetical protein